MEIIILKNNNKKESLGMGIITISILYLIAQGYSLINSVYGILNFNKINEFYIERGEKPLTYINVTMSIIIAIGVIIGIIFLLRRNIIGIFIFIGSEIISIIYLIILTGFGSHLAMVLIMPLLLLFFIYKKKDIYGLKIEKIKR